MPTEIGQLLRTIAREVLAPQRGESRGSIAARKPNSPAAEPPLKSAPRAQSHRSCESGRRGRIWQNMHLSAGVALRWSAVTPAERALARRRGGRRGARPIGRLWIGPTKSLENTVLQQTTSIILSALSQFFSSQQPRTRTPASSSSYFTVLPDTLALGAPIVPESRPALVVAFRGGDTAMGASGSTTDRLRP